MPHICQVFWPKTNSLSIGQISKRCRAETPMDDGEQRKPRSTHQLLMQCLPGHLYDPSKSDCIQGKAQLRYHVPSSRHTIPWTKVRKIGASRAWDQTSVAIFDRLTHSIKLVLRYRLVLYFVTFSFVSGFIIYLSIFGCDVLKTWFVFILHEFHSLRAQCPRTASKVKKNTIVTYFYHQYNNCLVTVYWKKR